MFVGGAGCYFKKMKHSIMTLLVCVDMVKLCGVVFCSLKVFAFQHKFLVTFQYGPRLTV